MNIIAELKKIISEYDLLQHTFYQAWSQGLLSEAVLRDYAIQYYHQVKSFPCFVSRVHSRCADDISVRKVLLQNLIDEELHGQDHPALWMQFAIGMGATEAEVVEAAPLATTQAMVDTYYDLADRSWQDGLCALYAYESQVPAVSTSKIAGLKAHYNITDEKTLQFFVAHEAYDEAHAAEVAALIAKHCTNVPAALQATREAARSLTGFLDGMCAKHQIVCEMVH
jgi:pyrroloquinoline-quinone synthase